MTQLIFFLQVLEINYQGHPQQDLVKLHAEIHFPNIDFSSTTVDFGCVLNYTETRKEICVTNCSPMSVSYRWTFLVDEELQYVCTEKCGGFFFIFNGSYFEQYPSQKYMSNVRKLQFISAMSIIWLFPQQAAEWGGKANQSSDQDRLWEEFLRQPPSWCRWRWTERRVERCGGRQTLSLK